MPEDFSNLTVEDIAKMLRETKDMLSIARESVDRNKFRLEKIDEELLPLAQKIQNLRMERSEIQIAGKDAEIQLKNSTERIKDLEHALNRAQLKKLEQEELEGLKKRLIEDTIGAPWREFAYDHQIDGAARLSLVRRGILGDQRGLGKTLTSLVYSDMIKSQKIIIFAPKETIKNFEEECRRWAPHRTMVSLAGKNKSMRDFTLSMLSAQEQWIVFVNLEAWRRDKTFIPALISTRADTVIVDEAHYIKEEDSVAFQGVRDVVYGVNICPKCNGGDLAIDNLNWRCLTETCQEIYTYKDKSICSVKNVVPMSGTTILNRPPELWTLLNLVDREAFPSKNAFLRRYCVCYGGNDWRFSYGGEKALIGKLGPQYIRRDRKDAGIKIPPQTIQTHELILDPEKYPRQHRAYQELKNRWLLWSESGDVAAISYAIVQITRLRQLITAPLGIKFKDPQTGATIFECDIDESVKLDYAENLAKELILEEGERVIMFSQFREPLHDMKKRLDKIYNPETGRNISSVIYDGSTPDAIRDRVRHDFDLKHAHPTDYEWDVVLCNYKVAGQSINLTAASQTIVIDREWNPGKEDQAFGRNDRIGQTKETTVHILSCIKTIDDWLDALIAKKADIINGFDVEVNMAEEFMKALHSGEI